jgi:hypothetical protein
MTIRTFAAAVQSGDIERVKRAYPGITETQLNNWQNLFRAGKPEQAIIRSPRGISTDANGVTTVEFSMAIRYRDRTGSPTTGPFIRYQAKLKVQGANAALQSLTP